MSAPAVTIPQRRWGDEPREPAPALVVLTSSRDRAAVPAVVGAVRLERAAQAAGWTTRQQYALADVPAGWPSSRSKARRLATVAVVLARRGVRGYVCWESVDGGAWRFASAVLAGRKLGLREALALLAEVSKP